MNILNYKQFACFDYESKESSLMKLGDVVFKKDTYRGKDISEIGVVIQVHDEREFRTDMFGNACISEVTIATREQVEKYRPALIKELDVTVITKRTFFILTERKRIKNRISFYIGEIIDGKMKLIDNDFNVPAKSNKGVLSEAISQLVKLDVLYGKYIGSDGYINSNINELNIISVESNDTAYINFY